MAREGQGYPCYQRDMMMMMIALLIAHTYLIYLIFLWWSIFFSISLFFQSIHTLLFLLFCSGFIDQLSVFFRYHCSCLAQNPDNDRVAKFNFFSCFSFSFPSGCLVFPLFLNLVASKICFLNSGTMCIVSVFECCIGISKYFLISHNDFMEALLV